MENSKTTEYRTQNTHNFGIITKRKSQRNINVKKSVNIGTQNSAITVWENMKFDINYCKCLCYDFFGCHTIGIPKLEFRQYGQQSITLIARLLQPSHSFFFSFFVVYFKMFFYFCGNYRYTKRCVQAGETK